MNIRPLSIVLLMIFVPMFSWAQSDDGSTAETAARSAVETTDAPLTTAETDVPLEDLRVMIKPLTKAELAVEADAWFELLRAKARQIAVTRIGVRKTSEAVTAGDEAEAEAALEEVEQVTETAQQNVEQTEGQITQSAQENLGVEDSESPDGAAEADDPKEDASQESNAPAGAVAAEMKGELLNDINELQDERAALYDRLEIVLDSLEEKGGDVAEYWQ